MTNIRLIAFDFDGVIVESNSIKTEAFGEVYRKRWGESTGEAAVCFHLENPGLSRYEKFAHIHRIALGREITNEESAVLGREFSNYCYESIIRCPFVPGAREFIESFSIQMPLAIVSATPEFELIKIAKTRGIARFFRYILGKPESKERNLAWLLEKERLESSSLAFVGDQLSDWQAALNVKCHFILRTGQAPSEIFCDLDMDSRQENLVDLDNVIFAI